MIRAFFRTLCDRVTGPPVKTFTKCASGQNPMVVALGWEKEQQNPYYWCDQDNELYVRKNGEYVRVPTKTFSELLRERGR